MSDSEAHLQPRTTGKWIAIGLLLGVACGLFFGEYCRPLDGVGQAYVGLLQMTVLPYLVCSLIGKLGRLDLRTARRFGLMALCVLLCFWSIGILVIVAMSSFLPRIEGASFFSSSSFEELRSKESFLSSFVPSNVFQSLAAGYVPAVVVFCLFMGTALIRVPGKERLLEFLDLCTEVIRRMNLSLVRLAPLGLFFLTASAAGTMRFEEFTPLQAYLVVFGFASALAIGVIFPMLMSSLTGVRYVDILRAAQEPLLTAFATGKLFVVLPQIVEKSEQLIQQSEGSSEGQESTASLVVPLAYSFPHLGKIFAVLFVSFAAWYVGDQLDSRQTLGMATRGAVASFASPLVTIPFLLDEYQLPQDLLSLFILPGFLTTRIADLVGVMHLMAFSVILATGLQGRLRIHWNRLIFSALLIAVCLACGTVISRWYFSATKITYDLDERLMSLAIPEPYPQVTVYGENESLPTREMPAASTMERLRDTRSLRIGFHPDHLPYSFVNRAGELVGLDIELMHLLGRRLDLQLEFIPYTYDSVLSDLESGRLDLVAGGLMVKPERLLRANFTQQYQTATLAIVLRDYRRDEFTTWEAISQRVGLRLAVAYEDLLRPAERQVPNAEIVLVDSIADFFVGDRGELDGLIMQAEEGAAWNVLYPEFSVVVPRPVIQRPVAFAVRSEDRQLSEFMNRWIDFERLDGTLERLRAYWIEGEGARKKGPRWSVLRDVLKWKLAEDR